jgi:chorismate mutase
MRERDTKIDVYGPCGAETKSQVKQTGEKVLSLNGHSLEQPRSRILRASLWKPRTRRSWDGVKEEGIPWLDEVLETGQDVATEVTRASDVYALAENLAHTDKANLLLWIGARNQNHFDQEEIAEAIKEYLPKSTQLMIKNPPWPDKEHWEGVYDHVLSTGFPEDRVLGCYRGFFPYGPNPDNLRNIPDWKIAHEIKQRTGLRMIGDFGHLGKTAKANLAQLKAAKKAGVLEWLDGVMLEVHPSPAEALSDRSSQLSFQQLDEAVAIIES